MSLVRALSVVAIAALLGIKVVQNAAVSTLAEFKPSAAARVWSAHPEAELGVAMTKIGAAARRSQPIDRGIFEIVESAARKAPLAPEPFLVRGVQAQVAGNEALARLAFEAAERRDPRSLPAHYFLADDYLRSGDIRHGLAEFAALARLAPNGTVSVTPFVASYAREPSRWPQLKALFRSDPDLAEATLEALAQDPANTNAILSLADLAHRNAKSPWLPILLATLVTRGDYEGARSIWAEVARVRLGNQLLFDANFNDAGPPPPFNWTLTSSTVGLAERQAGGRLHVIYYGQEDGALASQLLVLAPGRYALAMHVTGSSGRIGSLRWTLTCPNSQTPLVSLSLTALAKGPSTFDVPAGCGAQRLELAGSSSDVPQQVDITLGQVSLRRVNARG